MSTTLNNPTDQPGNAKTKRQREDAAKHSKDYRDRQKGVATGSTINDVSAKLRANLFCRPG